MALKYRLLVTITVLFILMGFITRWDTSDDVNYASVESSASSKIVAPNSSDDLPRYSAPRRAPAPEPEHALDDIREILVQRYRELLALGQTSSREASSKPDSSQAQPTDCSTTRSLGVLSLNGAPCTDIGGIINQLAKGTYSFNKPKTATVDEAFSVRLTLQTKEGQAVSFEGLPGAVEKREDRPFAQFIEATLMGDDFEISPAGPQSRTATFSLPVEWNWKVKPTSVGTKYLTIQVDANIVVGSDKNHVQLTTLHEPIEIYVSLFQRVGTYFAGATGAIAAVGALVTPLAAIFAFVPKARASITNAFKRFRRKKPRKFLKGRP